MQRFDEAFKKGKVLALDYGTRRIGVASGDLEHRIAFPRETIENKGRDFVICRILQLIEELSVVLVVIGWPFSMRDGQIENAVMKDVKALGLNLREVLHGRGVSVEYIDERLSSFEASEKVGRSRKVDAEAAQVILQRWFDQL